MSNPSESERIEGLIIHILDTITAQNDKMFTKLSDFERRISALDGLLRNTKLESDNMIKHINERLAADGGRPLPTKKKMHAPRPRDDNQGIYIDYD